MSNNIVVVGSCMIDFTSYVSRLPKEGETIHGSKFTTTFGGKGANQCVAAAKMGAKTAMVARVGDDIWGEKYIENFHNLNVDYKFVQITSGCSSGIAQINVADYGENQIVIVAAANKELSAHDVDEAQQIISEAAVVVCQLETSPDVAVRALQHCKGISILNGAPAIEHCDKQLLTLPTIFCVNEIETEVFTGLPVKSIGDAEIAAKALIKMGCNNVILTLGSHGVVFTTKDSTGPPEHIPARDVECVDSTGAGDAFIGVLAHLLANRPELSLRTCIGAANYVAGDTVNKPGTQKSFPGPKILEHYFENPL